MDGVFLGGRGFGAAMSALVSYLSSEYGKTFALGMAKYESNITKFYLVIHGKVKKKKKLHGDP